MAEDRLDEAQYEDRMIPFPTALWVLSTALTGAGMPRDRARATAYELLNDADDLLSEET